MSKRSNGALDYRTVSNSFSMVVAARNDEQKEMMRTISENMITFVKGMPGSGKTFLAVSYALQHLLRKKCEKIIFTRPTVEAAGERLGFLPGDIYEKINPYMIPIFDTLIELIAPDLVNKLMNKNGNEAAIRVLPLAFMRGCTFKNTFVVADEMQNATPDQIRMLLTRIGEGAKMIICGDVHQSDIGGYSSGLQDAFELLQGIKQVGFVILSENAVVRHPIVAEIDKKYHQREMTSRIQAPLPRG